MVKFLDKIWVDYPVPKDLSIWSHTEDSMPVESIEVLLETSVQELSSDVMVTEYIDSTGMVTQLADDTICVICAKLTYSFQGNRYVKFTFDKSTNQVMLRYYPAVITYKRRLRYEDLDNNLIRGDELKFVKLYILWKMAAKELQVLKSVTLDADNGSFNLESLDKFCTDCKAQYDTIKEDILIYSTFA